MYDGASVRLYVDGLLVNSVSASGALSTYTTNINIGNNTTANDFLAGTVDDLKIFNRALNQEEVDALCKGIITNTLTTGLGATAIHKGFISYPNPCGETLYMSFDGSESDAALITIYDLTGKLLVQTERSLIENREQSIDVNHLNNGVYILKVQNGTRITTSKIIISK